jgi:hypothetical protein
MYKKDLKVVQGNMKRGKVLGVDSLGIEVFKEVDYALKMWWKVYNEMEGNCPDSQRWVRWYCFTRKEIEKI